MSIKKWFKAKKLWLQGGIIGVTSSFLLGIFYVLIYLPIINLIYGGKMPDWPLFLPLITGHGFPLLAHFLIPHGWLCEFDVPNCVSWVAEKGVPGSIPTTLNNGQEGSCITQIMVPSTSCANLSEIIGFLGIVFLLFIAYFIVGALIGWIIQKRKAKQALPR